ncbi:MAG: N-6 DNA methylase [Bryobacterales bacterium]|nr:N-6 DNA methylase [Bryobacterales bacterium]
MRYNREANVVFDIAQMICSFEQIRSADIEREHASGSGRIDIFLPRFRTVIEVKKPSRKLHAYQSSPTLLTDAQGQMERYVSSEIQAERARLDFEGRPLTRKRWTGIVSDGICWQGWTYSSDAVDPASSRQQSFLLGPDSRPEDLLETLAGALNPDPALKTWIPANPSELFKGRPEGLKELYESMPAEVQPGTRTKLALWHDMLRASGLSPQGRAGDKSLFALHSFLIAVARMVTHLLSPSGSDWKSCLEDGFATWVLDWPAGVRWAESLWGTVRSYDWRSRRGDVLRAVYESFVAESDRYVFGEYYTPDWLAGMMVEQALDDAWLEQAVGVAETAWRTGKPLKGVGVLDPACGSGTFLYHAALRILQADAMRNLRQQQRADTVALLLHGIDVHPVAVEVAKATVLRALPAEPSGGAGAIRIHLGDSLLPTDDYTSLFGHREGAMRLETPQGREFFVPLEFVRQDTFPDDMRRLVLAAVKREPVPPFLLRSVSNNARQDLEECRDALVAAVQNEGNSVWTWYAVNRAAPHLLAERKVDRIVTNPPWVKLSSIQEPERRSEMLRLQEQLQLRTGHTGLAGNFDIAMFFVLRGRELYLKDPDNNPASWLVKRSALTASHWEKFRKKLQKHVAQTVDLVKLQPFGGGDARRCCLLFEHTAIPASDPKQGCPVQMKAELRTPRTNRPAPNQEWTDVRARIRLVPERQPPVQMPSDYAPQEFRTGANVAPHVLVLANTVWPQGRERVLVQTHRSIHAPWNKVAVQDVEIPSCWLSRLYRSRELLAYSISPRKVQAIIPRKKSGELALESAEKEYGWEQLNRLWQRHRTKGTSIPDSLAERIDFNGRLSVQPEISSQSQAKTLVLYPASGDIMRAARAGSRSGIVSDTLYWHVAGSEAEAQYLVALLNAPCLKRAFRKARKSGRHFHQHPWRKVPIPRFNVQDKHHMRLAKLCSEAEAEALRVRDRFPGKGQVKVSKEIRARLADCGIAARIDALAEKLLPEQADA